MSRATPLLLYRTVRRRGPEHPEAAAARHVARSRSREISTGAVYGLMERRRLQSQVCACRRPESRAWSSASPRALEARLPGRRLIATPKAESATSDAAPNPTEHCAPCRSLLSRGLQGQKKPLPMSGHTKRIGRIVNYLFLWKHPFAG